MRRAACPSVPPSPGGGQRLPSHAWPERGLGGLRVFLALFATIAALRLALLLGPASALHGDEATVGVLALRIIEHGDRPVFALGASYNGGSALTAYLAALLFACAGPSEVAVKVVPYLWSLLALSFVYVLVRSRAGALAAAVIAGLYGTSSALLRWNLDARGAYVECQALLPLAFWLLLEASSEPRPSNARLLLVGLVCGFGIYLLPAFVPVAVTCAVWLLWRAGGDRVRRLGLFAGGLTLGLTPQVLSGIPTAGLTAVPVSSLWTLPRSLWRTLSVDLPAMLAPNTLYGVPPARLLPNGLELLALTGGLSLLALPRARSPERQSPLVPLLLTYVVIYLGAYALHPQAGNNARYLLFLEPPLSILAGLGYVRALDRSAIVSRAVRASAAILLAALVSARGHEYARLLGDTAIWGPSGRSQPRTSEVVAGFLRAHGIAYAMAEDYDLRWRIAFQTRETVQVFHLSSRWFSDPPLAIRGARHYALIVAAGNPTEQWMVASFARRGLSVPRRVVEGFAIYLCSPEIPCAGAPGSAPRKGSHGARRVGG